MDDIKPFAKNEKELETLIHTVRIYSRELETLIHTVRIYSRDIGMEFGIEKSAMLVTAANWRNGTTKSR